MSAACELHAGAGYWSQDSTVQVLGNPESATKIWVRWPGGKIVTADIPKGAKEIALDTSGKLEIVR